MKGQLVDLSDARSVVSAAQIGRKAATLHGLNAAGLPVPRALALTFEGALAVESGDAELLGALQAAARDLGFPVAVRSSANVEDLKGSAAPGLFHSVLDVDSEDALPAAVHEVLASGRTPLVEAYLDARGIRADAKVAVIVQKQIYRPRAQGCLYTRPPGQARASVAIVEAKGGPPLWIDREGAAPQVPPGFALDRDEVQRLWELAKRAEEAMAQVGGLDIEWVWDESGPYLVQARPIVHRADLTSSDSEVRALIAFSRGDQQRLWRLDATHNPLPLSPAQAGLVQHVRDIAPYDMRVVGGYLYTASRGTRAPTALSPEALRSLYHDELLPRIESILAPVEKKAAPTLSEALAAYAQVFRCYTEELSPAIAAAGADHGSNPLSAWLMRAQQGAITIEQLMREVAPIAPAWDVAVPTYGERPEVVRRALSLEKSHSALEQESLSEADDLLFYRAQYAVRRALLAIAERWKVGDAIFFMPLSRVAACADLAAAPDELRVLAERARAEEEAQRAVEMPLAFTNGEALPARLPPDVEIWRGLGTGGFARGTVLRVSRLGDFPEIAEEDEVVLVMPTVSPAHVLGARGAVAVVCEYGEHLGHGAAMARELNIPCIVGCHRAWRELRSGELVAVHGQAGLVARIATKP